MKEKIALSDTVLILMLMVMTMTAKKQNYIILEIDSVVIPKTKKIMSTLLGVFVFVRRLKQKELLTKCVNERGVIATHSVISIRYRISLYSIRPYIVSSLE